MRRDHRTYLWDAVQASDLIAQFTAGKSYDDYRSDALLLVHGYDVIDDALVWDAAMYRVPPLRRTLGDLLAAP